MSKHSYFDKDQCEHLLGKKNRVRLVFFVSVVFSENSWIPNSHFIVNIWTLLSYLFCHSHNLKHINRGPCHTALPFAYEGLFWMLDLLYCTGSLIAMAWGKSQIRLEMVLILSHYSYTPQIFEGDSFFLSWIWYGTSCVQWCQTTWTV